jgi:hypothetical protein
MADLILSSAYTGPHSGVVAQISLDVGGDDMTVYTITRDEPLARDLLRHSDGSVGATARRVGWWVRGER